MAETRWSSRSNPSSPRLLAALLFAAAACGMEPASQAEPPPDATASARCSYGYTSCSGVCVNLRTNAANCGYCGHACSAGQVCSRGTCTGCPAGTTLCNGSCVNLSTSASNCGTCGSACATGASCSGGNCACPGSQVVCANVNACVDTGTSASNCGTCGNACPSGETCSGGACACPGGSGVCGDACVSLSTAQNCGSCGNACASGLVCVAGTCATGLSVGAHTFKNDVAGRGTNPMTTAPVNTQPTGSTFVVFAGAGISGGTAFQSLGDNMGNTYAPIGTPQSYATNQGELRAFVCSNCRGGTGHTWSLHKPTNLANWETVLFVVEVLGAPALDAYVEANLSRLSAGLTVTTSKAGDMLLVCALAASYGSPDRYTPSAGFTLLDDQTNGSNSLGGGDAWELAGAAGSYAGTLTSSLASSGAIFLVALSPP